MPRVPSREEVQTLLSALLVTRKEAFTCGIPLAVLDQDYKEQEGTRIPFRQFNHTCLLDFLQSLSGGLSVKYRDGLYYAYPVITEKSRHVSQLVAGQNSKKSIRGKRRMIRQSAFYPRVFQPPVRLDSKMLADIVRLVKNNPSGVHMSRILQYARDRLNYNLDFADLVRQLRDVSHEIMMERDVLYPVTMHHQQQQQQQPRSQDSRTNGENRNDVASAAPMRANEKNSNERPGGFSDSELGDDDYEDDFIPLASDARNDASQESKAREKRPTNSVDTKDRWDEGTTKKFDNDHEMYETGEKETVADLINERTRIRLKKLIEKHPDGILCAELPAFYLKEYTIPLNYEDLGFDSVRDYASYLPEIFQYERLQNGEYKLFNAEATKPNIKDGERTKLPTLASLHNMYDQFVVSMEPIPTVLSRANLERLIPDGVMTLGETVRPICVTELHCGTHEYIDVVVADVFTPSFFWIQLPQRIPKLDAFMIELHEFYEIHSKKYLLPIAVMEKGMNCACIYIDTWHRGIIKSIGSDNMVKVEFYDYGTQMKVPASQIHFLHKSFSALPAQAIACGLYNVKPVLGTQWPRNISCEFVNKVMNVTLVATIGSIDTDNNSMLVALTNTEGTEDFHINDWMVQSGMAVYGKMGDTVDLTDKCYDGPMELTPCESSQGQYETPRKPPGLTLTTISEEDLKIENGNGQSIDFGKYLNDQIIGSLRRSQCEIEGYLKYRVAIHPATIEALVEYMNFLRNALMPGNNTQDNVNNHQAPTIPPLPKLSARNDASKIVVDDGITNGDEYRDNNENLLLSFENNIDTSINIPSEALIDFTTDPPEFEPTSRCNGTIDEQSPKKIQQILDVPATTISRRENLFNDIEPPANETASFFTESPAKNFTSQLPNQRKIFEDTLAESAKNFFDRSESLSRPKGCFEPLIGQLSDTNPFRNEMNCVVPSPPLPERSQLRRPHGSPNIKTKGPTVFYEAGPVMYKNDNNNVSSNERVDKCSEIAKEREELLESKRINVESWIERGHSSNDNFSNNIAPPPVPPRTVSVANVGKTKQFTFVGEKFSDNDRSNSSWQLTVAELMDPIAGSFEKNEKILESPSDNGTIKDCEYATRTENSLKRKYTIEQETIIGQTVKCDDTMERENFSEQGNVRKIQISHRVVFLIIYQNEGWLEIEEFVAAFTANRHAQSMLEILKIRGVDISFLKISRSDNSSLFNEIERSYCSVSNNHNKIGDFLNLVPLKSTLKILRKLMMIDAEQVSRATKNNIFPDDSPVLSDIFKVITAWREIR